MVEFTCPKCGQHQLNDLKGNPLSSIRAMDIHGSYVCSNCGTELSREYQNDLFTQEVQETTLANKLKAEARTANKNGDYASASAYYQQLLTMKPNDWEAAFYSVCCNSRLCNVAAVGNACDAVKMCLPGVFDLIDQLPYTDKPNAIKLLVADACLFALNMFDAAVKYHASLPASAMTQHSPDLKNQLISALNITITCADLVMKHYGDDDKLAANVEMAASAALKMQSRQHYVTIVLQPDTSRTLLEWIGRFNPQFVEDYKKQQNRSVRNGTIALVIFAAIFFAIGYFTEGMFSSWFCMPMAIFCGAWAIFRIIIQLANKKLNG